MAMPWDLNRLVETYLRPFAVTETALSSVLAVLLNHEDARRVFLDHVEERAGGDPSTAETIERLRQGEVEVVVEAFMANAGNIDLALVSRADNAILAVENKTISQLSKLQLWKYRLALQDSDPARCSAATVKPRRFATVLLRPAGSKDPSTDADRANDPSGFDASTVVSYEVVDQLLDAIPGWDRSWPAFFGPTAVQKVRELHAEPNRRGEPTPLELRGLQLRKVVERMTRRGWSCEKPMNTSAVLRPPGLDRDWKVQLGSGPTSCMNIQLGGRMLSKDLRGDPAKPPLRLVQLAGGFKSVGIPTPFPSTDRPWTEPDETRLEQQAAVAEGILLDALEMVGEIRL
jgi:hypothetical protein